MKRRSLTLVLCLLATLSLASVGFAAWVISAGDTESATGNFQVDEVHDKRLTISNIQKTAPDFIFGKGTKGTHSWLNADSVDAAVMSITVTFDVDFKNNAEVITEDVKEGDEVIKAKNSVITAYWDDETQTLLEGAVTAGYIADVPELTVTETATKGTFQVVVTFAWGKLFNNENPYKWYNDHEIDGTLTIDANGIPAATGTQIDYATHANTYLTDFYDYFNGKTYSLTLSAQPYPAVA